jgi:hypothetical protein
MGALDGRIAIITGAGHGWDLQDLAAKVTTSFRPKAAAFLHHSSWFRRTG